MFRRLIMGLVAVTLIWAGPASRSAGRAPVFSPPFRAASAIASDSSDACVLADAPVPSLHPRPRDGRVDIAEGFAVTSCPSARRGVAYRWTIGAVPPHLVGRAGELTVVLLVARSIVIADGGASAWRASITLSIVGATGRRTLVSVDCHETTCIDEAPGPGRIALSQRMDALPAVLSVDISAEAVVTSGTASLGVAIESTLIDVRIRPTGRGIV